MASALLTVNSSPAEELEAETSLLVRISEAAVTNKDG